MRDNGFFNRQDDEDKEKFAFGAEMIKPMGGFDRIVSIFASPVKLFKNIRTHPKILAPFVIFLIMGIITGVLTMKYAGIVTEARRPAMEAKYGAEFVNFEENGSELSMLLNMSLVDPSMTGLSMALSGIFTFLSTYGTTGLMIAFIYFILVKILKGEAKYPNIMSMIFHILIVDAVGSTIILALGIIFNTPVDVSSLAVFLGRGAFETPLYNVLNCISVFSLWHSVLIIFGLKTVCGLPLKKAVLAETVIFVISVLFAGIVVPMAETYILDTNYQIFLQQI